MTDWMIYLMWQLRCTAYKVGEVRHTEKNIKYHERRKTWFSAPACDVL